MLKTRALTRKLKTKIDPQLQECFAQLTGEADPPEHVVREKNHKLQVSLNIMSSLLQKFSDDRDWKNLFNQDAAFEELAAFAAKAKEVANSKELSYSERKEHDVTYKCAKLFLDLGKMAGRFIEQENKDVARDQWIRDSAGNPLHALSPVSETFAIVPTSWYEFPEKARDAFLGFLCKILRAAAHVRHVLTTPDADVDEMVDAILKALDALQKRKPRCRQVFAKIREAAGMLRENFNEYYSRFLRSGRNSTVICTSFLDDVMKNNDGKMSPSLIWEFRELRKLLGNECQRANVDTNPVAQKLLKIMDDTLDAALEKN